MVCPITGYAAQVDSPDELPTVLAQCFATASTGRRRPAFVQIPTDVLIRCRAVQALPRRLGQGLGASTEGGDVVRAENEVDLPRRPSWAGLVRQRAAIRVVSVGAYHADRPRRAAADAIARTLVANVGCLSGPGNYGTEPAGTIHSTGWAVIPAMVSKSRS